MIVDFEKLKGQTITEVHGNVGDERMIFETAKGGKYSMWHDQDCCESVTIEDIIGDIQDVIGSPVLLAEESSNNEEPTPNHSYESFTWTFYKLSTIKGSVTIRWLGESNGYYSEYVDFHENRAPVQEATSQE